MAAAETRTIASRLGWSVNAVLKDGAAVAIRPLLPRDRRSIWQFFTGLSLETLRHRYFIQHRVQPVEMDELMMSNGTSNLHVAAFRGAMIVGIADYRRITADGAEMSFLVSDAFQGLGLGSTLLQTLAAVARDAGICCLRAEALEDNERMLAVFRHSGFPIRISTPEAGAVTVILDLRECGGVPGSDPQRD